MAIHSSILAWEIPLSEDPCGLYSPRGHKRVGHDLATKKQQKDGWTMALGFPLTRNQLLVEAIILREKNAVSYVSYQKHFYHPQNSLMPHKILKFYVNRIIHVFSFKINS